MPPKILHSPLPLTEDCHHYTDISQVPWDIQKSAPPPTPNPQPTPNPPTNTPTPPLRYYHQRHSLFTLYTTPPGIHLTDTAWFGVTPEPVAQQIAADLSPPTPSSPSTIIDIFAGAGGNTIAFALSHKWTRILAIERDPATLACAQHNARVYGVYDAITWILGDSFEVLALLRGIQHGEESTGDDELASLLGDMPAASTVVFASPPWGGVSYADTEVFDLGAMEPYSLGAIHEACREMRHVLFLPRNSDVRQVAGLVKGGREKVEVVQYCMFGASKGMVAYIPGEAEEVGR